MNPNEKMPKLFECKYCNFNTSKESNFSKHLLTLKHKILIIPNQKNATQIIQKYTCSCGKEYKHMSTLCSHKKKCYYLLQIQKNSYLTSNKEPIIGIDNKDKVIELLVKENLEFKNIVLEVVKSNTELQKQLVDVCNNNSITNINSNNNSHNKTFNLQFFLNEQCKDAMNISDFANSFDLELADLESLGDLGYIEGITKIIVDKLSRMDIYKRPMHCSDAKREILYIKDEDRWAKEPRNNPKLRHAIKTVSFKSMKLTNLWSDTYPESKNGDSRLNDKYMKLIKESTGGNGEIGDSENKIIRRIAKEIIIEKV